MCANYRHRPDLPSMRRTLVHGTLRCAIGPESRISPDGDPSVMDSHPEILRAQHAPWIPEAPTRHVPPIRFGQSPSDQPAGQNRAGPSSGSCSTPPLEQRARAHPSPSFPASAGWILRSPPLRHRPSSPIPPHFGALQWRGWRTVWSDPFCVNMRDRPEWQLDSGQCFWGILW